MTTAATALTTIDYQDLGVGPLIVEAFGLCEVTTAASSPAPSAAGIVLSKAQNLPIAAADRVYAMALNSATTIVAWSINKRIKRMARAMKQQQHDDDPSADARNALKIAIEEKAAIEARAASLLDAAQRGDEQVNAIDSELAALENLDEQIAEAEAQAIKRGKEFVLPPKLSDAASRCKRLQEPRGNVSRAAGRLHGELSQAETSLRLAAAAAVDASAPLMLAESDMLATEVKELEAKILDARMRLSALALLWQN
jgi:hypothetical protein